MPRIKISLTYEESTRLEHITNNLVSVGGVVNERFNPHFVELKVFVIKLMSDSFALGLNSVIGEGEEDC